ncbi:MAG: sensor histidine kinase, partial [Spirochaetales bacterium]|nr:sensor histidine kinase [Spirochaetales bacterium]
HSLLGAAIVVYIFYLLLRVRVNRYNAETQRLEEMVAERTKGLREEMERTRELQGDLQITLAEKNHLLKEKDVLLKEVLHRTKNNMQLISSFISLERDNLEDSKTDNALEKSMNRINTLALAHELLYRSENLNVINLKVYVERLVREIWSDLFDSNVLLETTIPRDIPTNLDFAIPLGLMLNEFITNAFRYAFPDHREGVVSIDIRLKDQTLVLLFRDNGVGMPSTVNPQSPDTLGLQLVSELLQQNGGTYILRRDEGTEWEIQIPFTTDRA